MRDADGASVSRSCRSLTGDGVRATLRHPRRVAAPRDGGDVPSGTQVFDWTVGDEWNVREAYVADASGRRWSTSRSTPCTWWATACPVRATPRARDELRPHLHTLPDHPDWIPYRTSYYHRDWGFCLPHACCGRSRATGPYDVVVDAVARARRAGLRRAVVPGDSEEEVIVTSHVCHPSLANDNLTGIVGRGGAGGAGSPAAPRRYTYRFVFAPGTIGVPHLAQPQPRRWSRGSGTGSCSPGSAAVARLVYKRDPAR